MASLAASGTFVLTQTVRHRDFFLPVLPEGATTTVEQHAPPPAAGAAASLGLLWWRLSLWSDWPKVESPAIKSAVEAAGFPLSFVGVVIAVLVLAPEVSPLAGPGAGGSRSASTSPTDQQSRVSG